MLPEVEDGRHDDELIDDGRGRDVVDVGEVLLGVGEGVEISLAARFGTAWLQKRLKIDLLVHVEDFFFTSLLPAFPCRIILASHFRTGWLSLVGFGNQVGLTTDHLQLLPTHGAR